MENQVTICLKNAELELNSNGASKFLLERALAINDIVNDIAAKGLTKEAGALCYIAADIAIVSNRLFGKDI